MWGSTRRTCQVGCWPAGNPVTEGRWTPLGSRGTIAAAAALTEAELMASQPGLAGLQLRSEARLMPSCAVLAGPGVPRAARRIWWVLAGPSCNRSQGSEPAETMVEL